MLKSIVVFLITLSFYPSLSFSIEDPAKMTELVGITPHISEKVDLTQQFTDSSGVSGSLSSFLVVGKPNIIVPVYYGCPRLCGLVTAGVFESLVKIPLKLGDDYGLVFISMDARETHELAQRKKIERLAVLKDQGIESVQFKFLVGSVDPVRNVMQSLGFHYKPDGDTDFAHSAAIMLVDTAGEITHYFLGIEFNPSDLRLALVDASNGIVGTFVDHMLLYCFRFDPTQGKYTWAAVGIMRIGGILTLIGLAILFATLWRRYRV